MNAEFRKSLIGVPVRSPRAVGQPLQPAVIVAIDELVGANKSGRVTHHSIIFITRPPKIDEVEGDHLAD
jgi:hypothetical protein